MLVISLIDYHQQLLMVRFRWRYGLENLLWIMIFYVFGCPAYYHVKESKLDPRVKKSLFIGISPGVKGYRLKCSNSTKIIISRDVTFDEQFMMEKKIEEKAEDISKQVESDQKQVDEKSIISPTKIIDAPEMQEVCQDEEISTQESQQQ